MAPCNDAGPAFLLDEIGPTCHPLHIQCLLIYSNMYPLKFPKIQLVSKSSVVRPSVIPHTASKISHLIWYFKAPRARTATAITTTCLEGTSTLET